MIFVYRELIQTQIKEDGIAKISQEGYVKALYQLQKMPISWKHGMKQVGTNLINARRKMETIDFG